MLRSLSASAAIIISIFLFAGCSLIKPTGEERLKKAQEYESSQKYEEALKEYAEITATDPTSAEALTAHFRSAGIYYKHDSFEKAALEYTKVIELDHENADAIYLRGVCYAVLKKTGPAEEDLKKIIAMKPDLASAHYVLGEVYLTKGDIGSGITSLTRAIELDPANPEYLSKRAAAFYNRGRGNNSREDYLSAVDDYTKVIETSVGYNPAFMYKWRAGAYLAVGEYPKAIEDYNTAIKSSPLDPELYNDRGLAYFRAQEFLKAKEDYMRAVELDPNGAVGKIAYSNLELLVKILEEKAASPQPLSQDEIDELNSLEKEWGMNIDKAVPLIRERNFSAANIYIGKARESLIRINNVLAPKNYSTEKLDRMVAMNELTTVYSHLNDISAYASDPAAAARDWAVITGLLQDAHRGLNVAEEKFHELPQMQGVCREIRAILNSLEAEIRKAMNAGGY